MRNGMTDVELKNITKPCKSSDGLTAFYRPYRLKFALDPCDQISRMARHPAVGCAKIVRISPLWTIF
jgi:hypothetical protein